QRAALTVGERSQGERADEAVAEDRHLLAVTLGGQRVHGSPSRAKGARRGRHAGARARRARSSSVDAGAPSTPAPDGHRPGAGATPPRGGGSGRDRRTCEGGYGEIAIEDATASASEGQDDVLGHMATGKTPKTGDAEQVTLARCVHPPNDRHPALRRRAADG